MKLPLIIGAVLLGAAILGVQPAFGSACTPTTISTVTQGSAGNGSSVLPISGQQFICATNKQVAAGDSFIADMGAPSHVTICSSTNQKDQNISMVSVQASVDGVVYFDETFATDAPLLGLSSPYCGYVTPTPHLKFSVLHAGTLTLHIFATY